MVPLPRNHLLGVPQTDVPEEAGESCRSMSLPPHELIQIGRQHLLMDTLHPLEFSLHAVPIGLHIFSVDSCHWVNKVKGVVHCVVCILVQKPPAAHIPAVLVGLDGRLPVHFSLLSSIGYRVLPSTPVK